MIFQGKGRRTKGKGTALLQPSGRLLPFRGRRGFTLVEMMITLVILGLLAGMIFMLLTGILQSASVLQDNSNRSDRINALYDFIKTKLTMMPARSTIASYARGDGEGLVQNGIIFGNTNLATAIDGKIQPNGLYLLRICSLATSENGQQQPQDARVTLTQSVTTDDPTLSWTTLIPDVKTMSWKFQDPQQVQWDTAWTASNTPNLVEFDMQGGGDLQATTMDFWVPKINPITVRIPGSGTGTGGGGTGGRGHGGTGQPGAPGQPGGPPRPRGGQ